MHVAFQVATKVKLPDIYVCVCVCVFGLYVVNVRISYDF